MPDPHEINTSSGVRTRLSRVKGLVSTVWNHFKNHTGVGIVCAVAYFDPGNWGVDLQAGSQFGYRLLFVVLLAGLFAVLLQVLASRLGCVTGLDLASHCRLLLHDRPNHTILYRCLMLYPLYALSEIAIISTDLAELLGSAIALCLLFPSLPLWAGVLITAFDVIFLLALGDPLRGRPVKMFEYLIASLVLAVLICMAIIIAKVDVHWGTAFDGYIPSKYIFSNGGLYTSVGILGATVMPHSLFLGSALATQDRISSNPPRGRKSAAATSTDTLGDEPRIKFSRGGLNACLEYVFSLFRNPPSSSTSNVKRHADRENNLLAFVNAHIYHGIIDIVLSLLGFAVLINSLILILASAVFFYGNQDVGLANPASLFDAYALIRNIVGKPAALLFALALLAAGQSSSIIATVAGQAVSEGFLQWRVSPVVRRLLTRLLGLVPSMVVAIGLGKPGINALLVASQVVLSIVLPFILFPLIYLTSSRSVMEVRKPTIATRDVIDRTNTSDTMETIVSDGGRGGDGVPPVDSENQTDHEMVDYSNGKIVTTVAYSIWLLIVVANAYVIVLLAMGQGG